MYVYLQAYEPGAETVQPLVAFVTFYRGHDKAFETAPVPVTEGTGQPAENDAAAIQPVAWTSCPPGEYNCQVTVLDPGRRRPRSGRRP